jgi:hypothetical protein
MHVLLDLCRQCARRHLPELWWQPRATTDQATQHVIATSRLDQTHIQIGRMPADTPGARIITNEISGCVLAPRRNAPPHTIEPPAIGVTHLSRHGLDVSTIHACASSARCRLRRLGVVAPECCPSARLNGNFARGANMLLGFWNIPILEFGNVAMFFPLFAIKACIRAIITTSESGKSVAVRGGRGDVSPSGHGKLRRQSSALLTRR